MIKKLKLKFIFTIFYIVLIIFLFYKVFSILISFTENDKIPLNNIEILDRNTSLPTNGDLYVKKVCLDDSLIFGSLNYYEYRYNEMVEFSFLRPVSGRDDVYLFFHYCINIDDVEDSLKTSVVNYNYDYFKRKSLDSVFTDIRLTGSAISYKKIQNNDSLVNYLNNRKLIKQDITIYKKYDDITHIVLVIDFLLVSMFSFILIFIYRLYRIILKIKYIKENGTVGLGWD